MAVSTIQKSNVSGSLSFAVGATSLALLFDKGDLNIADLHAVLNAVAAVERRGKFQGLVHGARVYPTFTFTAWITQFSEATGTGDLIDWVLRKDAYSALVSTIGQGLPFTSDLTYTLEGTDFGDSADHTFTMHDVYLSCSYAEAAEGLTLSVSGTVYGEFEGDIDIDEVA